MYKYIHTNTTNGFLLISGSPYGLSCLSCIQIHIKHRRLYGHPTHCDSFARYLSFPHTISVSLCLSQRLVNLIWHDCQSKCFSNFPTVWLSLSLSLSVSLPTQLFLSLPVYRLYSFYVCVNTLRCCSLSLLLCLLSTTISTTLKHCVMECAAFSTTKY